jgi:hypothetical protein
MRIAIISFVMCPSVNMEELGSHLFDFNVILYLSIFRKTIEKFQVTLKSDKNNGHFTWRPLDIFDDTLLSFS